MQDLNAAEQSVIGALLLTNGKILDELDFNPRDYHQPVHEVVHRTIAEMKTNGQPIDALTVMDTLARAKEPIPATFLHDAMQATPSAASASHYAGIVTDAATLRRVQSAAVSVQQMVNDGGDADVIVEESRKLMDGTQPRSRNQRVSFLEDTMEATINYLDEDVDSIPTVWPSLNDIITGLRPGAVYVVGARPSVGKALALDTPIPTPTGWTVMGEVAVGEYVIGMDGKPTRVVAATEVMTDRPCYRVTFKDGSQIVADEQHQWLTSTRSARRSATPPGGYVFKRDSKYSRDQRHLNEVPCIKTTGEIFKTQRTGSDARVNHIVPSTKAVQGDVVELNIDPYLFGYWLGDGSSRWSTITIGTQDYQAFCDQVDDRGYYRTDHKAEAGHTVHISNRPIQKGGAQRDTMQKRLRELGVLQNKHIPMAYKRASEGQRRELLAGLLDSDGTACATSGRVAFAVTSETLARDFEELARSLGYVTYMGTKRVSGRSEDSSTCFTVGFMADREVFGLARKNARLKLDRKNSGRSIVKVERIKSVPVRCIQVDNQDHMYLCGEGFIPTHNSVVAMQMAQALLKAGSVAFVSLEMSVNDLTSRLISNELKIDMGRIVRHDLTPTDWKRISEWMPKRRHVPLAINDNSGSTIADIRAFARNVNRRKPLAGVVVDYLQLMSAPVGDRRPRHEFVSEMSRQLKILAMDLHVPVIALSQLNRSSESREDKRPGLSDLRESGSIEQDADVVILLHREIMGDKKNDISFAVAKNRHGATGMAHMQFAGHYSEVRDQ